MRTLTRPDSSVTTYEYDILNRLAQMTTRVGETVVNSYAYTYNEQDLRAGENAVEAAAPTPYADELVNYEYNNVNALLRLADPGEKPFTYDASGNLTQGYTPEGYAFTAAYDGSNRLTSLSYTDGAGAVNQTQFFYIGHALFWKKNYRNGVLTKESRYKNDGSLPVQERNGSNTVVNEYTYGLGLPGGIGGLLHLNQGGAHYSYLYDGKGNVTALLDGNANVAAAYQYDPFGKPRGQANSLSQPFQFSTKPYDEKTGLSYYGYRFYVPALGRWLTRDPIGEDGGINLYGFVDSVGKPPLSVNLYTFVNNNTVNYIDPDGRFAAAAAVVPLLPLLPRVVPAARAAAAAAAAAAAGAAMGDIANQADEERRRRCEDNYDNDLDTCRAIKKRRGCDAARRCYESAMRRYANCLRGLPLPPLDTWNN